jgi:hypothetical protein
MRIGRLMTALGILATLSAGGDRARVVDAAEPATAAGAAAEAYPGASGDLVAGGCGCTGGLVPVCRRVPIKRKKPHTEYSMKRETVCVPGCGCLRPRLAGHRSGECTPCGCTSCGSDSACGQDACGDVRIRSRKSLLKKVTQREVESYEYKVEWVCPSCAFGGGCCGPHPGGGGHSGRGMVWLRRLFGHL